MDSYRGSSNSNRFSRKLVTKMEKKDFFVKKNEIVELDVFGQVFKLKRVTADDELNWIEEYREKKVEKDEKGNEKVVYAQNLKKLALCKLRNIVEVPFSKEELKEITGIDKEFKDYSNEDKDILFGQLEGNVMNKLISLIDKSKSNQKKS